MCATLGCSVSFYLLIPVIVRKTPIDNMGSSLTLLTAFGIGASTLAPKLATKPASELLIINSTLAMAGLGVCLSLK